MALCWVGGGGVGDVEDVVGVGGVIEKQTKGSAAALAIKDEFHRRC